MALDRQKTKFAPGAFAISLLITLGIGGLGASINVPQINGWYAHLNMPSFNPPNWLFGPVWTILYIMIGTAAYLVWQHRDARENYIKARRIYILQLLLNFLWSAVFFGLHQIFIGFVIIILLLISIVVTIKYFGRLSAAAAWLLVPCLFWVSFASALNLFVYLLN